jgi:hypothetical protein
VKALVFRHKSGPRGGLGHRRPRRPACLRLPVRPARIEDIDELPLPAADRMRVETTFGGLRGSDVKQILLNGRRDNPLTALVSFPHVIRVPQSRAVARRAARTPRDS